jgi:hypothetical protein
MDNIKLAILAILILFLSIVWRNPRLETFQKVESDDTLIKKNN